MQFNEAFVVTHIAYRNNPPFDAIEGPYSSVCNALEKMKIRVYSLQIPLFDFTVPYKLGLWKRERSKRVHAFFGMFTSFKYVIDIVIVLSCTVKFFKRHSTKKTLVVGIDPLSCFALCLLKPIYGYKLTFYCVDFNEKRFHNPLLQFFYKKFDEFCSKKADLVWATCEALQDHIRTAYNVTAFYVPNSNPFTITPFKNGIHKRSGNKICWTGSCITERQFRIVFSTSKKIQDIQPNFHFYYAPVGNYGEFRKKAKTYGLKKYSVLELKSRREWQDFVATCDVGFAVYDERFGSTKYVEPLKIWDFMMCGVPFIVSCEPSVSKAVKESGVAYLLQPKNTIPQDNSLKKFLDQKNLTLFQNTCLQLARKYDIGVQMVKSLSILR